MSAIFHVPCPGCGEHMRVLADGDLECVGCDRKYHTRMGQLLPVPQRS